MVFSSLVFLCIFLPTVFLLYTLVPSLKFRNGLLIVASLIFYAYGEPVYVLLMIFSSLLNYICARLVANENAKRKLVLVLAVVINLGILAVFKYSGFFVESLNSVTGLAIPVPQIDLPIGISFFTFQALSYVIDVYRKTVDAQKNYLYVLLYITFFPQLIAGPIVKYRDISEQIVDREQTAEKIADRLFRLIQGHPVRFVFRNISLLCVQQASDCVQRAYFLPQYRRLHFFQDIHALAFRLKVSETNRLRKHEE